jgi:hypothetical protein
MLNPRLNTQCEIVENVCHKVVRVCVTTHDNPEVCFVFGR